jgi:abortive infection bacteriophage resistance protein
LSAYWYPLRTIAADGYKFSQIDSGTPFDNVIDLYERDRKLRLLVMDAIERIEIATRTRLTYHLARTYGRFAQTQAANFYREFNHGAWLTIARAVPQRSADGFIKHYKLTCSGFPDVPVWMLTEVISLGSLSRL